MWQEKWGRNSCQFLLQLSTWFSNVYIALPTCVPVYLYIYIYIVSEEVVKVFLFNATCYFIVYEVFLYIKVFYVCARATLIFVFKQIPLHITHLCGFCLFQKSQQFFLQCLPFFLFFFLFSSLNHIMPDIYAKKKKQRLFYFKIFHCPQSLQIAYS